MPKWLLNKYSAHESEVILDIMEGSLLYTDRKWSAFPPKSTSIYDYIYMFLGFLNLVIFNIKLNQIKILLLKYISTSSMYMYVSSVGFYEPHRDSNLKVKSNRVLRPSAVIRNKFFFKR